MLEILVQLSRRQTELIDAGEMTSLIKLLAGKQTVMGQLQTIEQSSRHFATKIPTAHLASPAERAACQARAERCNTLLAEAMALEQQAETAMLGRRDAAAATLTAVQTAAGRPGGLRRNARHALTSLQVEG